MSSRPTTVRGRLIIGVLLGGLLIGCAPKRLSPRGVPGGAEVGVYRGRIVDGDGGSRRFRLLLFAAAPDRLHAEVVSPLGATELVLDGNDSALSVALPRERLAFVGAPVPETMRRLVGVRVSVAALVGSLLEGRDAGEGVSVSRRGSVGSLPRRFAVAGGERALELSLKRRSPLRARAAELGRGSAPAGFETRPLEELDWEWFEPQAVDTPGK